MKNLLFLFSALCAFTLFLAFLIGTMFFIALIIGGETAAALSSYTLYLKNISMYVATSAVFVGLLHIYIAKEHGLKFDMKNKNQQKQEKHFK